MAAGADLNRAGAKVEPLLAVHQVKKHFGGVMALNGPSLGLVVGRIFGLIGPNGSGKTTLFNLITGLIPADSGHIHFKGQRIDGRPPYEIAQAGVGRTFQITRVFPRLTALENLLAVAWDHRDARARARQLLEFVGLARLAGDYAGSLSFGQQKLVEFARVLMLDPDLVLLDEPAAGINRTLLNVLLDRVQELRDRGKTFLIVEHDMHMVMNLCEHVFVLDHGEMIAEGPPAAVQKAPEVIEAYFGKGRGPRS